MDVQRIQPKFVERVWGRTDLSPYFGLQEKPIGEVWFPLADDFPLLVKFIFTSARLSVQVHPDDEYARLHENSRGKTEMWHILAAEPGAKIALGFTDTFPKTAVREAIAAGTVEQLLKWVPVEAGDTVYTPAGVVHAIGAGVTLCEIQQNSDVTYRLYDYGRPRELHLEKGLHVAQTEPFDGRRSLPVHCAHFTTDKLDVRGGAEFALDCEHLLIPVSGQGTLAGEAFRAGEVWHVPAGSDPIRIEGESAQIIRTRCGSAEA